MTYAEARLIAEFNDEAHLFAYEQAVQHAIALIQKLSGASIFSINEAWIRAAIRKGQHPGVVARQWIAQQPKVKES
jgi:stage III sporulation protein SpoIIIAA